MAPVRQYQLGYVGDYLELVTQECFCLLLIKWLQGELFILGKIRLCCLLSTFQFFLFFFKLIFRTGVVSMEMAPHHPTCTVAFVTTMCLLPSKPPRLVPNSPDVLNLVMIRAAHSNIRTVNDCYYMLKEYSLVGFLFGSLPAPLSMVTMAKPC